MAEGGGRREARRGRVGMGVPWCPQPRRPRWDDPKAAGPGREGKCPRWDTHPGEVEAGQRSWVRALGLRRGLSLVALGSESPALEQSGKWVLMGHKGSVYS